MRFRIKKKWDGRYYVQASMWFFFWTDVNIMAQRGGFLFKENAEELLEWLRNEE